MKPVIFWGATGQAKVLREALQETDYTLVALFDNNSELLSPFTDIPLYHGKPGLQTLLQSRPAGEKLFFTVALGGEKGLQRLALQQDLKQAGLHPLTIQHPTAYIAGDARIGEGSQILAHATVCVEAQLGQSCIINTQASVDHECRLGDGVHVAPGATLAGCVEVENYVTIYTGAVVIPRIKIGEGAVVGAGAVVIHDVPPYTLVAGNPARVIKTLQPARALPPKEVCQIP